MSKFLEGKFAVGTKVRLVRDTVFIRGERDAPIPSWQKGPIKPTPAGTEGVVGSTKTEGTLVKFKGELGYSFYPADALEAI